MKRTLGWMVTTLLLLSTAAMASPRGRGCCDKGGRPDCDRDQQCFRGRRGHDGMRGPHMLLAPAEEINLTAQQKTKLKQMAVDFKLEKIDRMAEVKKAEVKLHSLMSDEDASENAVTAAIDNLAQLKADAHKMRFRHRKAIRGILTDEQIDRLKQLRKEKCGKMKGPHPGMGRGPGGPGLGYDPDPEWDDL